MTDSTPHPRPGVLAALWRPGGLWHLALCLAGLAAGLYPAAIRPHELPSGGPLPTLQAMAAGQVAFILLVHPVVLLARQRAGKVRRFWAEAAVESLGCVISAGPLYIAAAWLADAVLLDVFRLVIYLVLLWPVGWATARLMHHRWLAPGLLVGFVAALGLPAGGYIAAEFAPGPAAGFLADLAPATFAWQTAGARAGHLLPAPLWALLAWPAVATAVGALTVTARAEKP